MFKFVHHKMSNFLSLQDEEGRAVVLYTNTNNLTVALGHVSGKRKFQVGPTLFSFSESEESEEKPACTF